MSPDSRIFIIVWCLVCSAFVLVGMSFLLFGVAEVANDQKALRESVGSIIGALLFVAFSVVMLLVGILGYRQRNAGPVSMSQYWGVPDGCLKGAIAILLATVFLGMGAVGMYSFAIKPILQVIDARSWPAVPCNIVSSKVRAAQGESAGYFIEVSYEYDADGEQHQSARYGFFEFNFNSPTRAREIVDLLTPGKQMSCYVNPRNPKSAVIDRGYSNDLRWGLIPLLMLLIGATGLYVVLARIRARLMGKSAEANLSHVDGDQIRRQLVHLAAGSCFLLICMIAVLFLIGWWDVKHWS